MDELQHVIECLIAQRKAKKQVLKDFGFDTYKSFEEAKLRVIGAIPSEGISSNGYKVNVVTTPIYAMKATMPIDNKQRIQINEER